jgi:DNA-3-methyladenine glycosylase
MTPQDPPPPYRRLARRSLPTETTALAQFLIGKVLVHDGPAGRVAGRIVETEAYLPGDAAAHSFRGKTKRNQSLFLPRGHAYVYFIYGTWFAMNVSGGAAGIGAGVLLRAAEPLEGVALMQARRPHSIPHRLAAGPGCLATAFAIDRTHDGQDLCGGGPLWLGSWGRGGHAVRLGTSVRIGINKETHRHLRYYLRGHPAVSGPRHLSPG